MISIRPFCSVAAALALLSTGLVASTPAGANDPQWQHGLSLYGELKYPAGFKHFDYVNPNAPKGGTVRMIALGSYDNFNPVIAGVKGSIAVGVDLIYDTLMTSPLDEVSTEYGLLAESVSHPPDFSSVTYRLRAEGRWHDGKPVTVDDVIFSFDALKKYSPMLSSYYRHVVKAEKTGERDITFTFDMPGNRELPQIVGQLTVLPKHWWEGTDASGRKRDIAATTLEPPLGAGAYRIKDFAAGRSTIFERVKNYWGKDLNVNIGRDNFDELRFEYFRDGTIAVEAFKADQVDWRTENSAKTWSTAYDFPAVRDKRVVREEFALRNVGRMQGFVFNMRRDKFKDPRVRLAFNYVFDFEEMNKQMFYGHYKRIGSYFDGTEIAWNWRPEGEDSPPTGAQPASASGLPEGKELEILETIRDKVPPEVFTKPFKNPVGGSPEAVRANLREATRLLKEAGYEIRDRKLVDPKTGEPFSLEFLSSRSGHGAADPVLQTFDRTAGHLGLGPHRRQFAIREPAAQLGLRYYDGGVAAVAVAGQRAARLLELAGGGPAGLAQSGRHQEPGGGRLDRSDHLRQGPRRTDRHLPRARSGPVVEPLRRAAIHPRQALDGALGPLRPAGKDARLWGGSLPHDLVVGCRAGGENQREVGAVRMRARATRSNVSRRDVLIVGAGAMAASAVPSPFGGYALANEIETHGLSVFGDLKYPADFRAFRLRRSERSEGRQLLPDRPAQAVQSGISDFQLAQQLHPQGRRRARDAVYLRRPDGARV